MGTPEVIMNCNILSHNKHAADIEIYNNKNLTEHQK